MIRKYFGTDGMRGRVNAEKMTAEMALRLGLAAGRYFRRGEHRHRVVIGKDTRLSGYMIEPARVRLHFYGHGCVFVRPDTDTGRCISYTLIARRYRRYDFGFT